MAEPVVDPAFEHLLEYLRDSRGFDFTGYKRATLVRRVSKRMEALPVESYTDYRDYLEVHPDEFTPLFNTILINVTSFFRDASSWELLRSRVLPAILEDGREPIRVWSAGCASGEEPYTAAMLLAEALGLDGVRDSVKIYATDVDEEALAHARRGLYTGKDVEPVPEALRERYLEPANGGFAIRKELRRSVIFGRHDLIQDAPISRVDLVLCRNTLMYFNTEAQERVYRNFYFALRPRGYLFLGKSEMLLTRTSMFEPVDLKVRVFRRVPLAGGHEPRGAYASAIAAAFGESLERLRDAAFENAAVAQVVLDADGAVAAANSAARETFGLHLADVGRAFSDLELSYRPVELRSRIEQAREHRRPVVERGVEADLHGERLAFDVEVRPLEGLDHAIGVVITFHDMTERRRLADELDRSRRELEASYEEIHSTVEELETTNEELQSTNEELETMNEELQSTNEELETINSELRERTQQLNRTNQYLQAILGSLEAAVIVLNQDLAVESWNAMAEDLWGLRENEVQGRSLLNLDVGLPVEHLIEAIRSCLSGRKRLVEQELNATNRRGRAIRVRVRMSALSDDGEAARGVILLMESAPGERGR